MAKITYKEGIEPLSGIYAGLEYKVFKDGRCVAYQQPLPTPKQVSQIPAARAEFIIKTSVSDIQVAMNDKREAMKQYSTITKRVRRLYARLYALEPNNEKLKKAIVNGYFQSRRVLPSRKVKSPTLDLVPP